MTRISHRASSGPGLAARPPAHVIPVKVRGSDLDAVMVRRLKEDIRQAVGGFARRRVVQIDIADLPAASPDLRLPELLDQYRQPREQRLFSESQRSRAASALLITGLQQRLLSSIEAFSRTLRVHRVTALRQWNLSPTADSAGRSVAPGTEQPILTSDLTSLDPPAADDDRAELSEEQLWQEEDLLITAAPMPTTPPTTVPRSGKRQPLAAAPNLFTEASQPNPNTSKIRPRGKGSRPT